MDLSHFGAVEHDWHMPLHMPAGLLGFPDWFRCRRQLVCCTPRDAGPLVIAALATLGQVACVGACDIYVPRRQITGTYYLTQFDVDNFYIEDSERPSDTPGGVLQGSVEQIGWSNEAIVVWRASSVGADSAWMLIDVRTRSIAGPFTPAEWAERLTRSPALAKIEVHPVRTAWEKL